MFFERLTGKCQSIVTILTTLTIVLSLTPSPCPAVIHGDVELLKTVALQHKANFESLVTWKGEAFEEFLSTRGDSYDYMLRNKCTFAYDQLRDAARWNKEPQENRFVVDGKSLRDIKAIYNSAMVKGKYSYEYSALGQRGDEDVFHLIIDKRRLARNWERETFEPRYFFSGAVGDPLGPGRGDRLYDRLMFLHDPVKDTPEFEWYVKRAGDLVTLEVSFGENKASSEKYVFDLSAGGNVLRYHNKGPTWDTVYEYQYEQKSGVWVPKSYEFKNITGKQKGAGARRSTRSIRWSNSVVNVPFEEDEFTVDKLGVKPGDKVSNWIIDMGYDYGDFPAGFEDGPASLVGKRLPSLEQVGAKLDPAELEDRKLLLCFWDRNQRPSRHMVSELGKRAEELKEEQVVAVLVQASKVDEKVLNEWVKENKIPFEVGIIEGDEEKTRLAWGVKSLPWLILTNDHHIVQAEGFQLEELNDKITALEIKGKPLEERPLKGKPLPGLASFGLKLDPNQTKGSNLLICFWDRNQRPSRHMVRELAKRARGFKQQGVEVVCVQASKVERTRLDQWLKNNKIPFATGMIEGDEEKVKFNWRVKSLPWLILTDRKHIVKVEGIGLDDLDEIIAGPKTRL